MLVGGGIGVTPFASILKDVVHKQANNTRFAAKKVSWGNASVACRKWSWWERTGHGAIAIASKQLRGAVVKDVHT